MREASTSNSQWHQHQCLALSPELPAAQRGFSRTFISPRFPCLPLIKGYLSTNHLSSTSTVCVTFDSILLHIRANDFLMLWVSDRPIDVEVVDYVLFLEPPTLCDGHSHINTNGQDAIIVEMVKVLDSPSVTMIFERNLIILPPVYDVPNVGCRAEKISQYFREQVIET